MITGGLQETERLKNKVPVCTTLADELWDCLQVAKIITQLQPRSAEGRRRLEDAAQDMLWSL
jgi:hypothetical protein